MMQWSFTNVRLAIITKKKTKKKKRLVSRLQIDDNKHNILIEARIHSCYFMLTC